LLHAAACFDAPPVPQFSLTRKGIGSEDNCLYISELKIVWDPAKASAIVAAPRVAFSEAATVLEDESALIREDADFISAQRFVTLGLSGHGNLLVVVYAYREPDIVRIISAWKANKRQRLQYEKDRR
jgi:uncharacterized DUF497 family protein